MLPWLALTLLTGASVAWAQGERVGLISQLERREKKGSPQAAPPPFNANRRAPRIPGKTRAHSLGLGVGQTFLFGNLGDYGQNSIALPPDLYYIFSASHSFSFIANLHYSAHKNDSDQSPNHGQDRTQLMGLALGIKGKLWEFDAFSPYLIGGLGFYHPQVRDTTTQSKNQIVLGTHLGLGAELQLNNHLAMGLLVHGHKPFAPQKTNGTKATGYYGKMLVTATFTF